MDESISFASIKYCLLSIINLNKVKLKQLSKLGGHKIYKNLPHGYLSFPKIIPKAKIVIQETGELLKEIVLS